MESNKIRNNAAMLLWGKVIASMALFNQSWPFQCWVATTRGSHTDYAGG